MSETRQVGCFLAQDCSDVGADSGDPGLSAALCDDWNFTNFCDCCRAHTGSRPALCPPTCWEQAAPSAAKGLPPTAPPRPESPSPRNASVRPIVAGCEVLNSFRGKGNELVCTPELSWKAATVLLTMLETADACNGEAFLQGHNMLEKASMAVLAGDGVPECTWTESLGAWTSGRVVPASWDGRQWNNVPTATEPGALLFSAGAVQAGCAEGWDAGVKGCGGRLCLLDPPLTTPTAVSPVEGLGSCTASCRGSPSCP